MPAANYTRRLDLFRDAGFADADAIVAELARFVTEGPGSEGVLSDETLRKFLALSPEWLLSRGGDLSTALWFARSARDILQPVEVARFCAGLGRSLAAAGAPREAQALRTFFAQVEFDYGDIYRDLGVAYGFFKAREPNPFVWKAMEFVHQRASQGAGSKAAVHVLELGCGIGNDAVGFLQSDGVASYTGTDVSDVALREHAARVAALSHRREGIVHRLVQGDFVSLLGDWASRRGSVEPPNLVYSYSSLHYFSSQEVGTLFDRVRALLRPGDGLFCFAIKGEGSVWDGQGVPLYRPDVWINLDGQSRWFPSKDAVRRMVDGHRFELLVHEWHEHWGYSEVGKADRFHYVICTPRGA